MKILSFLVAILLTFTAITYAAESCEIEKIIGAKVEEGTYKVTVKREESNLYSIVGQDIYIKTKYCYEYTYGSTAILEIDSPNSTFSIGKIYFMD